MRLFNKFPKLKILNDIEIFHFIHNKLMKVADKIVFFNVDLYFRKLYDHSLTYITTPLKYPLFKFYSQKQDKKMFVCYLSQI